MTKKKHLQQTGKSFLLCKNASQASNLCILINFFLNVTSNSCADKTSQVTFYCVITTHVLSGILRWRGGFRAGVLSYVCLQRLSDGVVVGRLCEVSFLLSGVSVLVLCVGLLPVLPLTRIGVFVARASMCAVFARSYCPSGRFIESVSCVFCK